MLSLSDQGDIFRRSEELADLPNGHPDRDETWTRLYSGKVIHHFNHRFASYTGGWVNLSEQELANPTGFVQTEYYAREIEVIRRLTEKSPSEWLIGYRDICRATDERTAIATIIPRVGCDTHCRNIYSDAKPNQLASFISNFNSFIFDYFTRQKIIGTGLGSGTLAQLPIIPPHIYMPALLNFTVPRVLELTYTAWDLQPFAQDVGYDGPPLIWDEERRFLMRCELDALYFHLYQIQRDDVDYIMETFPIVKRKDEAAHGEYLTKRIILEMYDQMAALPVMHVPAPKNEAATYAVPDVSQWATWLNPPPADPSVAHKE
jgi:hypothetical protein